MSSAKPCIYEREPIGVDGALEATTVRWFCSSECRENAARMPRDVDGFDGEWIAGTQCDKCGKPLAAAHPQQAKFVPLTDEELIY